MEIVRITDLSDPGLVDYSGLTDVALRRSTEPAGGLYIAESSKVIARALAAGHRPRSLLMAEKWLSRVLPMVEGYDVPVYVGDIELLESLTGFNVHRGALASMHRPALPGVAGLLADAHFVVVLEDIVDHTNVGAIFRSAAALGADAVFVTPRCADPFYRRSVRVSMGSVLQVPWTRLPDWPTGADILHEHGFHLAALTLADGADDLVAFANHRPEKVALLLGTEGNGLSIAAVRHADSAVTIPMMHGVDSLNVAAASAIALWALRQHPLGDSHAPHSERA